VSKSPHIVTAQEFIQNVADRLKARRLHLRWSVMDVQEKGGPGYHTVQKIEAGHVAAPDIMERHVTALGLTLRDVYSAALTPPGRDEPFSHAASEVARVYDQATPEGKRRCARWHVRWIDRGGSGASQGVPLFHNQRQNGRPKHLPTTRRQPQVLTDQPRHVIPDPPPRHRPAFPSSAARMPSIHV
jgi:hypothetical protein